MSSPLHLVPAWAPELARHRFSFSPAIVGVAHNEWTLHRVTVDDAVVFNTATNEELSIPRRYIEDVSKRVVTLVRRLEHVDGVVRPVNRSVIQMPQPSDAPRVRTAGPVSVIAIREEAEPTPRWKHYLRISVALGCLACFVAVYVFREGRSARVRRFSARPSHPVPHPPVLAPLAQ